MVGGDIEGRTSLIILFNASMKRNGQSVTAYALLNTYMEKQVKYCAKFKHPILK